MKVLIVGAGALGKCLIALLAHKAQVIVYDRNPRTRRLIKEGKIFLTENGKARQVMARTVESLRELERETIDLLIVATKIMDLKAAAAQAAALDVKCVFLPQNGIFDIRRIKEFFKNANVCRGVTTMACEEAGANHVHLFYRGHIYFGGEGSQWMARFFRKSGIPAKAHRNTSRPVWTKLIFSSVMNPLPVVTGRGYDVLSTDDAVWRLVRQAVEEGRKISRILGIRLAFDPMRLIQRVRQGELSGIKHRGSIVHDRNAGRSTELEYITGALIRQARKVGVKTPALQLIFNKAKAAGA